jgi:ankyrin repeat protein
MKHLLLTTIAAVVLATTAFADPIHDAARTGDLAGVQAELNKGVDVNAKNDDGQTPLHEAANWGHKETAELLIANGADVNARTGGWLNVTPLHRTETKEIAELLIANGADVNAKDGTGRTPLHNAAIQGHKEIAELLIAKGADVNAKADNGWTPLHGAAAEGHKEIAELLIANSADLNAQSVGGNTPLDFATPAMNPRASPELADFLRKHGGKTGAELAQLALMPRLVQHGRFAFSFDAKEGKVYEVQDSFDLLNWEVIKTYTGTGSSVRFDEERDHDPPKWFYRVRVVE